ncbi:MAG: hypothetical protein GXY83_29600, partial [Rhodopirellula sp.]|nr:hypothetical protein [Rhodopirellula sp.]
MALTVTEKEHWRDRISRRIDKKVEQLQAAEPNLKDRIEREARSRALQSLGLAEMQAELDRVEREKAALEKQEKQTQRRMLAHVRGVPVEDLADNYYGYHGNDEV